MESEATPQSSTIKKIVALLFFVALSALALVWFGFGVLALSQQLAAMPAVVTLQKSAFYMLGAGLALSILSYLGVYQGLLRHQLTASLTKTFNALLMGSLVLTFGLPPVVIYVVGENLEARGYRVCDVKSHQWRIYRDVVYVSEPRICEGLTSETQRVRNHQRFVKRGRLAIC